MKNDVCMFNFICQIVYQIDNVLFWLDMKFIVREVVICLELDFFDIIRDYRVLVDIFVRKKSSKVFGAELYGWL